METGEHLETQGHWHRFFAPRRLGADHHILNEWAAPAVQHGARGHQVPAAELVLRLRGSLQRRLHAPAPEMAAAHFHGSQAAAGSFVEEEAADEDHAKPHAMADACAAPLAAAQSTKGVEGRVGVDLAADWADRRAIAAYPLCGAVAVHQGHASRTAADPQQLTLRTTAATDAAFFQLAAATASFHPIGAVCGAFRTAAAKEGGRGA
mmetsp:Transcript_144538/g.402752  ORF Transcript_144538/g.402752 Transcript_144538/m.402752 type:complete len:207 (+) Transcript_144538:797-1417(+)